MNVVTLNDLKMQLFSEKQVTRKMINEDCFFIFYLNPNLPALLPSGRVSAL